MVFKFIFSNVPNFLLSYQNYVNLSIYQWWDVTKYIYFVTLLKQFILKSTCNEVHFGELLLLVMNYFFVYFLIFYF